MFVRHVLHPLVTMWVAVLAWGNCSDKFNLKQIGTDIRAITRTVFSPSTTMKQQSSKNHCFKLFNRFRGYGENFRKFPSCVTLSPVIRFQNPSSPTERLDRTCECSLKRGALFTIVKHRQHEHAILPSAQLLSTQRHRQI
eukprot:2252078-Amphidinium_carterae.1